MVCSNKRCAVERGGFNVDKIGMVGYKANYKLNTCYPNITERDTLMIKHVLTYALGCTTY